MSSTTSDYFNRHWWTPGVFVGVHGSNGPPPHFGATTSSPLYSYGPPPPVPHHGHGPHGHHGPPPQPPHGHGPPPPPHHHGHGPPTPPPPPPPPGPGHHGPPPPPHGPGPHHGPPHHPPHHHGSGGCPPPPPPPHGLPHHPPPPPPPHPSHHGFPPHEPHPFGPPPPHGPGPAQFMYHGRGGHCLGGGHCPFWSYSSSQQQPNDGEGEDQTPMKDMFDELEAKHEIKVREVYLELDRLHEQQTKFDGQRQIIWNQLSRLDELRFERQCAWNEFLSRSYKNDSEADGVGVSLRDLELAQDEFLNNLKQETPAKKEASSSKAAKKEATTTEKPSPAVAAASVRFVAPPSHRPKANQKSTTQVHRASTRTVPSSSHQTSGGATFHPVTVCGPNGCVFQILVPDVEADDVAIIPKTSPSIIGAVLEHMKEERERREEAAAAATAKPRTFHPVVVAGPDGSIYQILVPDYEPSDVALTEVIKKKRPTVASKKQEKGKQKKTNVAVKPSKDEEDNSGETNAEEKKQIREERHGGVEGGPSFTLGGLKFKTVVVCGPDGSLCHALVPDVDPNDRILTRSGVGYGLHQWPFYLHPSAAETTATKKDDNSTKSLPGAAEDEETDDSDKKTSSFRSVVFRGPDGVLYRVLVPNGIDEDHILNSTRHRDVGGSTTTTKSTTGKKTSSDENEEDADDEQTKKATNTKKETTKKTKKDSSSSARDRSVSVDGIPIWDVLSTLLAPSIDSLLEHVVHSASASKKDETKMCSKKKKQHAHHPGNVKIVFHEDGTYDTVPVTTTSSRDTNKMDTSDAAKLAAANKNDDNDAIEVETVAEGEDALKEGIEDDVGSTFGATSSVAAPSTASVAGSTAASFMERDMSAAEADTEKDNTAAAGATTNVQVETPSPSTSSSNTTEDCCNNSGGSSDSWEHTDHPAKDDVIRQDEIKKEDTTTETDEKESKKASWMEPIDELDL